MRVLFTTTGHSGHLLPLVPLARACERAGHDVLIATHAPRADNVERLADSLPPFYPGLYRRVLDGCASMAVRVLLTIGRDADPAALGPLPANAHAEPWLSQHDVLPHAAAVVSHAGYGTTLGALEHGVAHVMLPLFAGDQWRTARRVARLGAGLQLEEGERRVFDPPQDAVIAALPGAVSRVLEEARFTEIAQSLGAEMAALPPADAAAAALAA